jgi:hypothetical protein
LVEPPDADQRRAADDSRGLYLDLRAGVRLRPVDENDPEYDPEFDAGYTEKHVDRCSEIIDDFLASLEKTPEAQKNEYIMAVVKDTIFRLNELNEELVIPTFRPMNTVRPRKIPIQRAVSLYFAIGFKKNKTTKRRRRRRKAGKNFVIFVPSWFYFS